MSAFLSGILKSVFKRSGAKGLKSIGPAIIRGVKATAPKTIRGVKAGVSRAGLFPPKEALSTAGKQIVKSSGGAKILSQTVGKAIKPNLTKLAKQAGAGLVGGGSLLGATIALAKKKRRKNKK
jgi:hypothetical protein